MGIAQAVLMSTVVGVASSLPPSYGTMGSIMLGQGVAGVVTFGLKIVFKAAFPDTRGGIVTSSLMVRSVGGHGITNG